MTNENRSRVHAGVPAGGQFAAETRTESGVTLTAPSPLDVQAVTAAGDLARTRYAEELGRWQRRMDKGSRGGAPWPPLPEILVVTGEETKNFESLPRDEQEMVLEKLEIPGAKHLLEPGQRLGNGRVQVAEGLVVSPENLGVVLSAQKVMAETGIEGITLTEAGGRAEFAIEDGPLVHTIRLGGGGISISSGTKDEEEWDSERSDWLSRADLISTGGGVLEPGTPAFIASNYKRQREYAVMMDVFAASSFKGAWDLLGVLHRSDRAADLTVDGTEYTLDVSRAEPALKTGRGEDLHPSMVSGFLNHLATTTGHEDGAAFANDLREVFRETDRRLIP